MGFVEIFSRSGSGWEEWLIVRADGTVKYHGENDGPGFLRKGAEARNEILTPAEAAWRWPEHAQAIRSALGALGWDVTTMAQTRAG